MKGKDIAASELCLKTWYLQPLSNLYKDKIEDILNSGIIAYANLKRKEYATIYGLKKNVMCRDGSVRDLWFIDIDILTKIYNSGDISGYKIWCSRGGARVEDVTKNIDVFIAPKIDTIPWIRTPQKNSRLLVFK